MRKILPVLSILAITACAPASDGNSQSMAMPDEATIVAALDTAVELFLTSWNAGDADALSTRYTEDAVSFLEAQSEPIYGRNAIRTHFEAVLAPGGSGYQTTQTAVRLGHEMLGPDLVATYGTWETMNADGVISQTGFWSTVERITDGVAQIVLHTAGAYGEMS